MKGLAACLSADVDDVRPLFHHPRRSFIRGAGGLVQPPVAAMRPGRM